MVFGFPNPSKTASEGSQTLPETHEEGFRSLENTRQKETGFFANFDFFTIFGVMFEIILGKIDNNFGIRFGTQNGPC
jgi:hypothetical protein